MVYGGKWTMAAHAHGERAELPHGRDGALQHLQRSVYKELSGLAPC